MRRKFSDNFNCIFHTVHSLCQEGVDQETLNWILKVVQFSFFFLEFNLKFEI